MKSFLFFLLIVFIAPMAKAEYQAQYIKFGVETYSGKTITGYQKIMLFDERRDSLKNDSYLESFLRGFATETDTLHFIGVMYEYNWAYNDNEVVPGLIYQPGADGYVLLSDIKRMHLIEIIDFGYACWVSTDLEKNKNWIQEKPVEAYSCYGYLCGYDFLVHESSDELTRFFKELEAFSLGYNYEELTNDELENLDHKVRELLEGFQWNKYKVVIIECCTC